MKWSLQDAKNGFSKVVRLAQDEGPQTVTVRGERAAVVLSAADYDKLVSKQPSFLDHLRAIPQLDDKTLEAINARLADPDMRETS